MLPSDLCQALLKIGVMLALRIYDVLKLVYTNAGLKPRNFTCKLRS